MLPVGIMSAANTLVGNAVGEKRADKAVTYYKTSMILSLILAAMQVIFLALFVNIICDAFTNDPLIEDQMKKAWTVLLFFVVFDTTQAVGSSVIRGTGQ
jgi:Na+-driven multidrug efflux pump